MRCLVTGGGGFIGSSLCEALLKEGHIVRVFERPYLKIDKINHIYKQTEWIEGDFINSEHIKKAIQGCDIVFHLICTTIPKTSNENPVYDIESNLIATVNMLDAAKKNGTKKIYFLSSAGTVYGIPQKIPIPENHPNDPLCSYGITKLAVEKYLHLYYKLYGLDYCVLRISNPYGARQRVSSEQGAVTVFLDKVIKGKEIEIWGDGTIVRDYIYIEDVIKGIIKAIKYEGTEKIFNFGSGKGHSINEIIKIIERIWGNHISYKYKEGRPLDVPVNIIDISKAKKLLHWMPETSLETGIKQTLKLMQNWMANC
jgi:UDP-glucose 4-epimerase